jgi:hypothetical protein
MSLRDKIGLVILILLFVAFCVTLLTVFNEPTGPSRDPSESVIVEQRLRNLQQNR